jgi:hypothetical protein
MRPSGGILAVLSDGCFIDLASGNPAYHDGGTDHVGGALLAFWASGHQDLFSRNA